MQKGYAQLFSMIALAMMILANLGSYLPEQDNNSTKPVIDDWQYANSSPNEGYSGGGILNKAATAIGSAGGMVRYAAPMATADGIGFSTGGAKDINNFRANIENNYLPIPSDLTYEGLFYDYYFDTGQTEQCHELFCPSYNYAISGDPISGELEHYMSVGLNSGIQDFQRKKLNLVAVLDISGSMNSPFNRYYYDQFGNKVAIPEKEYSERTKMELAKEALITITEHLKEGDSFGLVLFENKAHIAKPLSSVEETDMDAIKEHIKNEVHARGGTYMEAGMREGTDLFKELEQDPTEYENRIIFMTDAMPNIGDISTGGLGGILKNNADNSLYTTFIGIGVDFNTELIEKITKIEGCNYYSVHSAKQFEERMDEGFDYMVTPLVFDLERKLESEGWEIEKVYGSPEADESTGTLMRVNTLFPSKTEEGETKGGIVLLKLKRLNEDSELTLKVSYKDREGNQHENEKQVKIPDATTGFPQMGTRKAILLTRYADLMKNWMIDERGAHTTTGNPEDDWQYGNTIKEQPTGEPVDPAINWNDGIVVPPDHQLGRWERQSTPLHVSKHYKKIFKEYSEHFEYEMDAIGDETLQQELDILEKLINY
ncbi:VWA domain-containing protein [archaeon]|nr:VWA domain-containing protein [archaeon]